MIGMDSTGTPVHAGDKVRFRGQHYTLKGVKESGAGAFGTNTFEMEEELHVAETPDEISIDLVARGTVKS